MPVTLTVSETIVREVVDRLEDYDDNGVVFTVYREVTHPERMTPTNYQVVVKALENARLPTMDRIGVPPVLAYQLTIGCYGQVMVSEDDTEAVEGHAYEIAGRIVTAITSTVDWYTMGGVAINSVVSDVTVTGTDAYYTGGVQFTVTYRVDESDPFQARG
jgi:hypothetical protein